MLPSRPRSRPCRRHAARGEFYVRVEENGGFNRTVTADLVELLAQIDSAFLATANSRGQPYAQHRGGPKGFIRVLDDKTFAFADYVGNRQYITTGNFSENDKAFLFLIDYAERRRIKVWGKARVVVGDADLTQRLMPADYRARAEQVILFTVEAWDANCPQHIPIKLAPTEFAAALTARDTEIAALRSDNARLRDESAGRMADERICRSARRSRPSPSRQQ